MAVLLKVEVGGHLVESLYPPPLLEDLPANHHQTGEVGGWWERGGEGREGGWEGEKGGRVGGGEGEEGEKERGGE